MTHFRLCLLETQVTNIRTFNPVLGISLLLDPFLLIFFFFFYVSLFYKQIRLKIYLHYNLNAKNLNKLAYILIIDQYFMNKINSEEEEKNQKIMGIYDLF